MGITPKVDDDYLARLTQRFGFVASHEPGLDTVATISALREGKIGVLVSLGETSCLRRRIPKSPPRTWLLRCQLQVHISTKLHRGHLLSRSGSLILPCLGRTGSMCKQAVRSL